MSITASANGNITLTDSIAGTVALKKLFSALSWTGTEFAEVQGQSLASGANVITLPISPIQFLYFKNTHATNTITISWTPLGGASNNVILLEPGSAILFCEISTGGGITSLGANASGASTTCEYVLAG